MILHVSCCTFFLLPGSPVDKFRRCSQSFSDSHLALGATHPMEANSRRGGRGRIIHPQFGNVFPSDCVFLGWHACRMKVGPKLLFLCCKWSYERYFPTCLGRYFVGPKKIRKTPAKFPARFPGQNSRNSPRSSFRRTGRKFWVFFCWRMVRQ